MNTKVCTKCNREFPATFEFFFKLKTCKYGLHSICKSCLGEIHKKYYEENKENILKCIEEYNKTEKGKEVRKKSLYNYNHSIKGKTSSKKYHQSERGKETRLKNVLKYLNTEHGKLKRKEWLHSERGKACGRKRNARRRKMKYIELFDNPFRENVIIEWHHIDDSHVVALPKDIHTLYQGKYHREWCNYIIKQIYNAY